MMFSVLIAFFLLSVMAQTMKMVYFLQLKEYRFDRIFSSLQGRDGRKLLFSPYFYVYFALLLLLFLAEGLHWEGISDDLVVDFFEYAALFFYPSFAVWLLYCGFQHKIFRPVWTKKAILLTITPLFFFFFQEAFILKFSQWIVVARHLARHLLLSNAFLPLYVLLCFVALQIATVLVKKRLYHKARKAISRVPHLTVIGITGSYGKSSTKEFLATILSERFRVLKTEGNVNSEIGIAKTVLEKLTPQHQVFVVEMGAYKKGEIAQSCRIVRPKIGIITGISEQHLSLFGSLSAIKEAKYELIASLPDDGVAIFNADSDECFSFAASEKRECATRFYSLKKPMDVYADHIYIKDGLVHCVVHHGNENASFALNVAGEHNVSNLLGAVAGALELGMSISEIAMASKNIRSPEHTLTQKKGICGTIVVDDSYSANPDGVLAALSYIESFPFGKKIMIMRSMIELGDKAENIHRALGGRIGEICQLCIMTSSDFFDAVKEGALEAGMHEENILHIEDPHEIVQKVLSFVSKNDIILLENRIPQFVISSLVS